MVNSNFTWSTDWIQKYESNWGIFEKFKYANAIDGDTILTLVGNNTIQKMKNTSSAGSKNRSLITLSGIDPKLTENIFGINLVEKHTNQMNKLIGALPSNNHKSDYHRHNLFYCPECLKSGFHSVFHQIRFFNYCAFHPNQELLAECIKCNKLMPRYNINRGKVAAFHCSCGYSFLGSKRIKEVFESWRIQPTPKGSVATYWLKLDSSATNKYDFIYPINQYANELGLYNKVDNLPQVAEFIIAALNNEKCNSDTVKITSKQNIFNMKSNYSLLRNTYKGVFPYRFTHFEFNESDQLDSIFFEIYKQTRSIYKSITRYILRKLVKDHHKCIKVFNAARIDGHVCPIALAFILWKMECEGKNTFGEIEVRRQKSNSFNFGCLKEQFSFYPQGVFMAHLTEILNSRSGKKEFILLDCNISCISLIVNRLISYLLMERFIKWLEVIQRPGEFDHFCPDDQIPAYLIQVPLNSSGEISFYLPNQRFQYMQTIISEIKESRSCPINKTTRYSPYKSPTRRTLERMDQNF